MSELRISVSELQARRRKVMAAIGEKGLSAMVLFNPTSIFYLTGFPGMPTERPFGLVLHGGDKTLLFVPRLELEHAQETAAVNQVLSYPEYPSKPHPMNVLAGILGDLGLGGKPIAADGAGYASGQGYKGPKLEDVMPGTTVTLFPKLIEEQREDSRVQGRRRQGGIGGIIQ